MKEFNKEEYNKLCALFLGWELIPVTALHNFREGSWKDKKWNYHFELKFDSDWNWIMEVRTKILSLKEVRDFVITCVGVQLYVDKMKKTFFSIVTTEKEAVVQAI